MVPAPPLPPQDKKVAFRPLRGLWKSVGAALSTPIASATAYAQEFEASEFISSALERGIELIDSAKMVAESASELAKQTALDGMLSKWDSYVGRKTRFYLDDPSMPRCVRPLARRVWTHSMSHMKQVGMQDYFV